VILGALPRAGLSRACERGIGEGRRLQNAMVENAATLSGEAHPVKDYFLITSGVGAPGEGGMAPRPAWIAPADAQNDAHPPVDSASAQTK
jgi:hypothetical protein